MRPRNLALLAVVLLVFGWQAWHQRGGEPAAPGRVEVPATAPGSSPAPSPAASPAFPSFPTAESEAPDTASAAGLPGGVAEVLAHIHAGGPFPYDRDGVVFGNFERRLPPQPRGYYHEYTVPTPGERGRGARRVIAGGQPPREFWYTADHYESFVRLAGDAAGSAR